MGADETAAAMDALKQQVADLTAKLTTAQDSGAIIANIAARDELYAKVSPFIGAFDHASMTADKLAAYAVGKIGLQVAAGAERVALDAWLHGRTPDSKQPAFAADSAAKTVDLNTLWKESK
jgi:predicted phage tail protein